MQEQHYEWYEKHMQKYLEKLQSHVHLCVNQFQFPTCSQFPSDRASRPPAAPPAPLGVASAAPGAAAPRAARLAAVGQLPRHAGRPLREIGSFFGHPWHPLAQMGIIWNNGYWGYGYTVDSNGFSRETSRAVFGTQKAQSREACEKQRSKQHLFMQQLSMLRKHCTSLHIPSM